MRCFTWVDNSAQAKQDSSRILIPSLWIAVYDPHLTLEYALKKGYTRMMLINANGIVQINLGLHWRQDIGVPAAYDYDLEVVTIPATKFSECDTSPGSNGIEHPCFTSLYIQFPTFQRQISTQVYSAGFLVSTPRVGSDHLLLFRF